MDWRYGSSNRAGSPEFKPQSHTHTHTHTHTYPTHERERERERERDRKRDRKRETERERQRERQRKQGMGCDGRATLLEGTGAGGRQHRPIGGKESSKMKLEGLMNSLRGRGMEMDGCSQKEQTGHVIVRRAGAE
jgi:hypothetical protein